MDLPDLSPRPGDLDPIETASRDELAALQLSRLQVSLRRAYDNVPHYRQRLRRGGRAPRRRARRSTTSRRFPFTTQGRPARQLPVRDVRRAARRGGAGARVVRYDGPADRGRLHARTTSTPGPTVMARSIRAAGGRAGMVCHVAYGYGLFTGGLGAHYGAERLGCTVVPVSGGMTERQVSPDPGLRARGDHGDAVVHAGDPRRDGAPGPRPGGLVAEGRHLRRRAVVARDAPRDRGAGRACTPSTSTGCRR